MEVTEIDVDPSSCVNPHDSACTSRDIGTAIVVAELRRAVRFGYDLRKADFPQGPELQSFCI